MNKTRKLCANQVPVTAEENQTVNLHPLFLISLLLSLIHGTIFFISAPKPPSLLPIWLNSARNRVVSRKAEEGSSHLTIVLATVTKEQTVSKSLNCQWRRHWGPLKKKENEILFINRPPVSTQPASSQKERLCELYLEHSPWVSTCGWHLAYAYPHGSFHLPSVLPESWLASVTPAAPHAGFTPLQEHGATTLVPALLQSKRSLHEQMQTMHLSGETAWKPSRQHVLMLYPECCLAEFPSMSLMDNWRPRRVPQGSGFA